MRNPSGESSTAIARVMPSIADFDAVYAITYGKPYCAAIELMLMMLPHLLTTIDRDTSRDIENTLLTLVIITCWNSASVTSDIGFFKLIPALLTRISIL